MSRLRDKKAAMQTLTTMVIDISTIIRVTLDHFFETLKCFLRIILFQMNAISYLDQTLSNKSKIFTKEEI